MVKTKRVYAPPETADGLRVLVMRLWPRGIRKEAVGVWLKELGADRALLADWKAGRVDWPERRRRYLAGLERPEAAAQLAELGKLARGRTVTLLCACADESQCHRSLLRRLLVRPRRRRRPRAAAGRPARRGGAHGAPAAELDATQGVVTAERARRR